MPLTNEPFIRHLDALVALSHQAIVLIVGFGVIVWIWRNVFMDGKTASLSNVPKGKDKESNPPTAAHGIKLLVYPPTNASAAKRVAAQRREDDDSAVMAAASALALSSAFSAISSAASDSSSSSVDFGGGDSSGAGASSDW